MPDLLVRNIDPAVYERMRKASETKGKSLEETAREALAESFRPSKKDIWAEIDRFRERIGPLPGDSAPVIREMRERNVGAAPSRSGPGSSPAGAKPRAR